VRINYLIPTKNESESITHLIESIRKVSEDNNYLYDIFLVDDSDDDTIEKATKLNAHIIRGLGQGLGASMLKGFGSCLKIPADFILTLDSDGQVDVSEIPIFVNTALEQKADVVISSRFLRPDLIKYRYPFINLIGNRVLVLILRLATGFSFTDSHGGLRLMRPETLRNLSLIGKHTYVQETLIHFVRSGYQIIELPSQWLPREHSDSRVIASIPKYIRRTLPGLLYLMHFHYLLYSITILSLIFNISSLYLAGLLTVIATFIHNKRNQAISIDSFETDLK